MEVTVSKTDITYNGWTGHGYIVIDPNTGAGGYMIAGGLNGGILIALLLIVMALALLALAVALGPVALVIVSFLMPFYLTFLAWLTTDASEQIRNCVAVVGLAILGAILLKQFLAFIEYQVLRISINTIRTFFAQAHIRFECFGEDIAE